MDQQYALFIQLIEKYQPFLLALSMVQARMFGFMTLFPLFSWARIQGQTRTMFSLAISFPMAMMLQNDVAPLFDERIANGQSATIAALFIKEAVVGLVMGILLGIPFWGVQSAGDVIDADRGATQQNQTDPVNAQEVSTTGTVLLLAGLSIFVIAGGLYAVVQLMYDSYKFWPIAQLTPPIEGDALLALGKTLTLIFTIGMIVAGPTLIVLFIIDLILSFENKLAPGVQLSDMSNGLKNIVVGLMMPFYGIFLIQYIRGDWHIMVAFLRTYLGIK
jgi:type III secretion protein T